MIKFINLWRYGRNSGITIISLNISPYGIIYFIIFNLSFTINCRWLWNKSKSGKIILFPKLYYRIKNV